MFRKPREQAASAITGRVKPEESRVRQPKIEEYASPAARADARVMNKTPSKNASILTFFKKVQPVPIPSERPTELFFDSGATNLPTETVVDDDFYASPVKKVVHDAVEPVAKRPRIGPFADDSDDEPAWMEPIELESKARDTTSPTKTPSLLAEESVDFNDVDDELKDENYDEYEEGEEFLQMKWMERQEQLDLLRDFEQGRKECNEGPPAEQILDCPLCAQSLQGLSEEETSRHVNRCLDGESPAQPPPSLKPENSFLSANGDSPAKAELSTPTTTPSKSAFQFKAGPPPIQSTKGPSRSTSPTRNSLKAVPGVTAFSKIMKGNEEDTAWASAAAEEVASRGKPAYQRTCPFYKIMPGFFICVDAFRYGAVPGCRAYFLSHFHSDHYIGLHHTWSHGPIYCSKVTANLVREQLRVDPQYVVALEFEAKQPVPGTEGVYVTMISANHCPGSSLFLFEKPLGPGPNARIHRVLHCGDFRASPQHIRHPALRPDRTDETGKLVQQKLDVCYLDTTYLNPKYAFPEQEEVIQACADLCVDLNSGGTRTSPLDKLKALREGATNGKGQGSPGADLSITPDETLSDEPFDAARALPVTINPAKPRLLVVIGTYSIGKERICVGIAKALKSKIFATAAKTRICKCLEDPELEALLTRDPLQAQIHMTPLMEIRAETLHDYLEAYKPHFSHVVGFRPSGWTYRPPTGRFIESPSVSMVLKSDSWVSRFGQSDLIPQRGSSKDSQCYGVPYSEHSSFRELTMFCCALRIDKIVPTVNIGSAKSREKMKLWFEKWTAEKKKNGLFVASVSPNQVSWRGKGT